MDLLDLLDHGSRHGLGVNPDLYCRELVRRVLLLSDGLHGRREGWEMVCKRVEAMGSDPSPPPLPAPEEAGGGGTANTDGPKTDAVTFLQDSVDALLLSYYHCLAQSRDKALGGIAAGAEQDLARDTGGAARSAEVDEPDAKDMTWVADCVRIVRMRYDGFRRALGEVQEIDLREAMREIDEVEEKREKIRKEVEELKERGEGVLRRLEEEGEREWKKQKLSP